MKRIALLSLLATAACVTTSARADTRISFGINFGLPAYRPAPPAVVCTPPPPPTVVYAPVAPAPHGYWKEVVVKTWVPERWVSSRDRWGRPVRICEPGYYTYRTDRVWVAYDTPSHHGRGHAYGYGHNNHDRRGDWRR